MGDLGSEMGARGMFDLKVKQNRRSLTVKPPKGKTKNYGEAIEVIRKTGNGEYDVYKSEPEVFLDCGDRYIPGEQNSAFCDCGRHCCKVCVRTCDLCQKMRICRGCFEVFRVKEKNAEEKIMYLCKKCFRKKKRERIIKTIFRIVLFPGYLIAYFFTKGEERK